MLFFSSLSENISELFFISITLKDWTISANAWESSTDDLWNAWNILRMMLLKTTLHLFAESHNTQLGYKGLQMGWHRYRHNYKVIKNVNILKSQ